jgi:membrane fusion protein
VVGIAIFLWVAQYSWKETAAWLPDAHDRYGKDLRAAARHDQKIHVEEGQIVRAGEPLLIVETNQIAADGTDVNASLLNTLEAQKDFLARNITAEEQRASSERDRLAALVHGLESEIAQLLGQIKIQSERSQVAESDVAAATRLRSKGVMTEAELRRRRVQFLEHRQWRSSEPAARRAAESVRRSTLLFAATSNCDGAESPSTS